VQVARKGGTVCQGCAHVTTVDQWLLESDDRNQTAIRTSDLAQLRGLATLILTVDHHTQVTTLES
jgi:hypothetical protein